MAKVIMVQVFRLALAILYLKSLMLIFLKLLSLSVLLRELKSVMASQQHIQLAQKLGLKIAIITGGHSDSIRKRYEYLGVEDVYMKAAVKTETYAELKKKYSLSDDEIMYMGDDIPDYQLMRLCGCPSQGCLRSACPRL